MTFRETSVAPRFVWSHWVLAFVVALFSGVVQAQCPNVLDGDGMVSANPNYLRCTGDDGSGTFSFWPLTDGSWTNVTVDWGDGTVETFAEWSGVEAISHDYVYAQEQNYTVTFDMAGCSATATVQKSVKVSSGMTPMGQLYGCAPAVVQFKNQSDNVTSDTEFTWHWAGQTLTTGPNDVGVVQDLLFEEFQTGCAREVRLEANNVCQQALFGMADEIIYPGINIWDKDNPSISATSVLLCLPDNTVEVSNVSERVCEANGNNGDRFERWNFGGPWGPGGVEEINWRPWDTDNGSEVLTFPQVPGTYTVTLAIENACGIDSTSIDIVVREPITADLSGPEEVCQSTEAAFVATAAEADWFEWDFYGTGSDVVALSGDESWYYNQPDTYNVVVRVGLDNDSESCVAEATHEITVLPKPRVEIQLSETEGCDELEVSGVEVRNEGTTYEWILPDGSGVSGPSFDDHDIATVGTHVFTLTATGLNGCSRTTNETVEIFPSPLAAFTAGSVCEGSVSSFTDLSLPNGSEPLESWNWTFGSEGTSNDEHPEFLFNAAGSYSVTLAVSDAHCSASVTEPIDVLAAPELTLSSDVNEGCSPMTVNFAAVADGAVTWEFGDGSGDAGLAVSHTYIGDPTLEVMFETTARVVNDDNCVTEETWPVTTLPSADASFEVVDGLCSPFAPTLTNTSERAISYEWTFEDGSTYNSTEPTHVLTNVTGFMETQVIQLQAFADNGCHDVTSRAVNIKPEAIFNMTLDQSEACAPFSMMAPVVNGAFNHNWSFGDLEPNSNVPNPVHVYENTTDEPKTFTLSLEAENSFGCVGEVSRPVTINPRPVAAFTADVQNGCSPLTIQFSESSQRAESFEWDYGDATQASGLDGITHEHTFTADGSTTTTRSVSLTVEASGGCSDTQTMVVEVYPEASFDMVLESDEVCSPYSMMAPVVAGATNHLWDFGDNTLTSTVPNPVHVYENNTDQPVTYTLALEASTGFGCPGSVQRDLVVNPSPVADFSADVQSGCAPLVVTFDEQSLRANAFEWTYGDGIETAGLNGVQHEHTFAHNGFEQITRVVTLSVEAEGGCTDSKSVAVEVYPQVVAQPVGETSGCAPWQSNLVAEGYESVTNHDIVWTIDGADAFEGAALQRTFSGEEGQDQVVSVNLQITSPFGCTDEAQINAVVHPLPVADIALSSSAACAGTAVALTDNSLYADEVTLDWGDGDGATTTPAPEHVFDNAEFEPRIVQVTQVATTVHGCTSTAMVNHTVYPEVTASFLPPPAACSPYTLTLVNQSLNANGTFTWNFGDGSAESQSAQPSHLFETPADLSSVYTIQLHATSTYGCEDSVSHDVEVHATPLADVEVVQEEGCYPLNVTFANLSTGGDQFEWNYGTGLNSTETASEHTVAYFNPTSNVVTYPAVLTVSTDAGCSSQDVTYVEVLPEVEAQIEGGMSGCSPLEVDLLNLSNGAASYTWNFGDGDQSTGQHVNHIFTTNPGEDMTYTVSLVAQSVHGCTDTAQVTVQVFASPVADFSTGAAILTYPETTVSLANLSTASASADHYWTFGDGQVSYDVNPSEHNYDTWGTYDITLEVDNGYCSSVANSAVQILAPTPTIGFSGEGSGCAPLTVEFDNFSTYASSYRWEFSDGSVRSDDSPVHVFNEPGVYDVTLFVEGYDGSELVESHAAVVEVFPTAQAAFTLNPNHVMVPGQPVFCLNLSVDATEYSWDFGDGNTSIAEAPTHEYKEAGVYDVTLTANNIYGCSTTYTLPEAVLAEEGGALVFPNAFTPSSTGSNGGYYDPTGYDNDVFRPMHVGVESYEMMVFTKWGEMIFFSNDVMVGWDGYIDGKLAPTDVYAWKATAVLSSGERVEQVGNVTLLPR